VDGLKYVHSEPGRLRDHKSTRREISWIVWQWGEELMQFNSPAVRWMARVDLCGQRPGYVLKIRQQRHLPILPWPDEITYPRMLLFDANGSLYTVTNTNQVARMAISEELND
jgi:hypothetical protein